MSAWGQQSDQMVKSGRLPLGGKANFNAVVIESAAGPVAVRGSEQTRLRTSSSWLIRRPTIEAHLLGQAGSGLESNSDPGSGNNFEISTECDTWFPCRASVRMEVAEERLIVRSAGILSIESFDGAALLEATDDQPIVLGQMSGTLAVHAGSGGVVGFNISSTAVDVQSIDGPVDLFFTGRPIDLNVEAGDRPVSVALPVGSYAVTINGESPSATTHGLLSMDAGIVHQPGAPNRIEIQSSGQLTLNSTNLDSK